MSALSEGAEIRRQRKERGWGAERFCQEIRAAARELGRHEPGVDIATVSRWERGKRAVSDDYRTLIDHAFGRSVGREPPDWRAAVLRRDFLRNSASAAGLAIAGSISMVDDDAWSRLAAALQGRVRLDAATVASLEGVTANLSDMLETTPPVVLQPLVDAQLANLTQFLHASAPEPLQRRLASTTAEAAILAGWLAWDGAQEPTRAQNAYLMAINAATVADDRPMAAYAIASASCLPAWRSSPADSIRLLAGEDDVHGFRATDATPNVRAWIASLLAEAHTRARNPAGAWDALDEAERMLAEPDDEPRPRGTFFTEERLRGERGVTAVRLGEAASAVDHLDRALESINATTLPKLRSRMLNHKARAVAEVGDVDTAVDIALVSLQHATTSGSLTGQRQIVQLAERLPVTPSTRTLRDALAS